MNQDMRINRSLYRKDSGWSTGSTSLTASELKMVMSDEPLQIEEEGPEFIARMLDLQQQAENARLERERMDQEREQMMEYQKQMERISLDRERMETERKKMLEEQMKFQEEVDRIAEEEEQMRKFAESLEI